MEKPYILIERAARCRRLARAVPRRDDPAVKALIELAAELDDKAAASAVMIRATAAFDSDADAAPRDRR